MSPLRLAVTTGLALGTAVTGLALAPAALAATPLPTPEIADATVEIGETITLTGEACFGPEDAAHPTDVYFVGPQSSYFDGSTQAAEDGTWTLELGMYVDIEPGTYQLVVDCDHYTAGGEYPPVTVTVVPEGWTPPSSSTSSSSASSSSAAATSSAPRTTGGPGAIRGTSANTPGVASPDTGKATGDSTAVGRKVVKVLTGFRPGEVVTVTLHSTPRTMGTFTADANGTVTVEFTVPAGTPTGDHTLVYEGDMGTYFQESFAVTATSAASPSLAYTGASVAVPLGLGAGALALGGGLVVVARRRAAAAAEAVQA
ncbi:hypothetical protein [Geodermatophilus maliterrae]|uniref:LPXTG-motif cell wall anchor domain-containing protein n=1 Tax=Geodermatophilus maliterrae TaxID=3162531 RepID=A0ABV3XK38_9ACTN